MKLDDEIHAAAFEPKRFQKVVAGLAEAVGAQKGLIWTHTTTPESTGLWVAYRLSEPALVDYAAICRSHDAGEQAAYTRGKLDPPGKLRIGSEPVPCAALQRPACFHEYIDAPRFQLAGRHRQRTL